MLVIGREQGRKIYIRVPPSTEEQTIELIAVRIRPSMMHIGIQAERRIVIVREELVNRDDIQQTQEGRV